MTSYTLPSLLLPRNFSFHSFIRGNMMKCIFSPILCSTLPSSLGAMCIYESSGRISDLSKCGHRSVSHFGRGDFYGASLPGRSMPKKKPDRPPDSSWVPHFLHRMSFGRESQNFLFSLPRNKKIALVVFAFSPAGANNH